MPNTLADWLTYLETLHPKTIALGLERVAEVKRRLDLQTDFPIVTVGGTNGKGSVCAMLESILHAAGYKVGCYTSPHLLAYNERVRIAKQEASDAELCAAFEKIEQVRGDAPLTYFEFGTLAAMQCFIEREVEVAILEVGLGGRLDAVNVFDCDCAVIASVDIDHTEYLGETREQIAFEKAGIMRAGKVAICSDEDVPLAVVEQAEKIGATLWRIGREFRFDEGMIEQSPTRPVGHPLPLAGEGLGRGQWNYRGKSVARSALPYPALRGAFQLHNASAALAALEVLQDRLPVSMDAVRRGLVEVRLSGRFQFLPGQPALILDVAHNPHAARSLARNLGELPPVPHTFGVFGMLENKDIAGVVAALDPCIDTWVVAPMDTPRSATTEMLEAILEKCRVRGNIIVCKHISDALRYACEAAGKNDRIVAFGSFHTVAEVMLSDELSR